VAPWKLIGMIQASTHVCNMNGSYKRCRVEDSSNIGGECRTNHWDHTYISMDDQRRTVKNSSNVALSRKIAKRQPMSTKLIAIISMGRSHSDTDHETPNSVGSQLESGNITGSGAPNDEPSCIFSDIKYS
jgi:hypothetical protein